MPRPAIGTAVREGRRDGIVVGHAGRGSMVDVQFTDVDFVERRSAERLTPTEDWAEDQKRAMVQAIYETLVLKELGRKNFRFRGERADVAALDRGTLDREDIDRLLSRAFAIATRKGQQQGDIAAGGAKATATGRALAALRKGANPTLVVRQMKAAGVSQTAIDRVLRLSKGRDPEESAQRLADYEETLTLRRAPKRRRNVAQGNQMPFPVVLRPNSVGAAIRAGASIFRSAGPAFAFLSRVGSEGLRITKDILNTPAGAQVAGAVVAVAVSILGRKVVDSGKLTKQEVAVVQDAILAQSGVAVPATVVTAAVKEST